MTNTEWLDGLKVGDKVVIISRGMNGDRISTVKRLTQTLIVTTGHAEKFRRNSGSRSGGGSYSSFLSQPTKDTVDRIRRENLIQHLRRFAWNSLPLEALREIHAITQKSS